MIAIVGGYLLFNDHSEVTTKQKPIKLSKSAYMKVPDSKNVSDKVDKKGVHHYKNKEYDINITSCSNLSASDSVKEIKKIKNSVATGSKKLKENNLVIYEKDGVYSIFVKNTQYNDTLLIQSSDKNLLLQCWDSVTFHDPAVKVEFKDDSSSSGSVIDVVEKTETAVKSTETSSSSSSSSDSSSDWGYDWRSSGTSSSGSSVRVKSVGGSASSDDLFDYDL